jgi:lysophospholipid acyltransferase (LPLAT)-like uncharacterized protein
LLQIISLFRIIKASKLTVKSVDKEKNENLDKAFQPGDLSGYPFGKRMQIRVIAGIAYWLIALVGKTVRFETEGTEHYEQIVKIGRQPIYALWHDRIFLGTYYLSGRKIVAMTSQSFDGEYIARIIQLQGNGAVRGSSTRGGVKGLVEMIRLARRGLSMCFIVDGPKGPPYVAKEGVIMLAKKNGQPILPFLVEAKHFRQTNSWDKLRIALPFTTAKVFMAEPIYVADDAEIEIKLQELQRALDDLVDRGKQWRNKKVN